MASLSTGSTNFPTIVYENPAGLVLDLASKMKQFGIAPEIEIFDLSHIHGAKRLIDAGLMSPRPHIQFVMGVQNALPADEHLLDILLKETRRIIPGASWTAAGIGREQSRVMQWALQRGADAVRTGMEDNIRIAKDRLASGNDELVRIAAGLLEKHGCRPATTAEARSSLRLQAVQSSQF
jgi:3-keto-5-aminohexanoate cleavage enzyme